MVFLEAVPQPCSVPSFASCMPIKLQVSIKQGNLQAIFNKFDLGLGGMWIMLWATVAALRGEISFQSCCAMHVEFLRTMDEIFRSGFFNDTKSGIIIFTKLNGFFCF
jgi:hypothetical protein